MTKWLNPIQLKGESVTLSPLSVEHKKELVTAASDGKLWELWYTSVPSRSSVEQHIKKALNDFKADKTLPFVVTDNASGKIIGSTRFLNACPEQLLLD